LAVLHYIHMRDSIRRQQIESGKTSARRRARIVLWSLPVLAALGLGVWLYGVNRHVDTVIAATEERTSQATIAFDELLPTLVQRRIDRENAENEAVRELVYQRTLDGYTTPPTLTNSRCNYLTSHDDPSAIDVLVSKKNCLIPLGYEPTTKTVYGATLQTEAADAYKQMIDAATADGYSIAATSSYRSYASQVSTYRYWLNYSGREEADAYSAYPGYSEHQTGLAADLGTPGCALGCFGRSAAYTWMNENAYKYGFIERYSDGEEAVTGYSYEPWHWRYVGIDTATEYRKSGATTLEEFWGTS